MTLYTLHQFLKVRFGNLTVDLSPVAFTGEKPTTLHQSQMLGGDIAKDARIFSELLDRITPMKQHLHNS